eukprot:1958561-Prymnesium_polylepis.1
MLSVYTTTDSKVESARRVPCASFGTRDANVCGCAVRCGCEPSVSGVQRVDAGAHGPGRAAVVLTVAFDVWRGASDPDRVRVRSSQHAARRSTAVQTTVQLGYTELNGTIAYDGRISHNTPRPTMIVTYGRLEVERTVCGDRSALVRCAL